MIINGKDKDLSSLPNVSAAIVGWFQPMTFQKIQKQQIKGYTEEITIPIETRGVRQPLSAQQIAIKPEGQRAWRWEMIHCLPEVELKTDDKIIVSNKTYRVMEKFDFSEYGYMQYNVVEDYRESA